MVAYELLYSIKTYDDIIMFYQQHLSAQSWWKQL